MNIPNFPKYNITDDGVVTCIDYNHTGVEKEIKPFLAKSGYYRVGITNSDMVRKHVNVHRLVALAYIDNPDSKPQVNHIDGIKTNNHISNLEWNTAQENIRHSFDTGLNKGHKSNINGNYQGTDIHTAKLNDKKVYDMRVWYKGNKGITQEPWLQFGISRNTFWYAISEKSKNRTWKHVAYPA